MLGLLCLSEGLQISTDGEKHLKATDFTWLATRNIEALAPKNPQQSTQKSIKKGDCFLILIVFPVTE